MDNCVLCGSTDFFTLDDGRTYCSICQTRTDDVEEGEEFFGVGSRIRNAKTQKVQEKARNWTSFEAFNLILAQQTDIVAELCNLGSDFKKLVFSLWAAYLEKNEIAFQEDVPYDNLPRLQQIMLERDYNFIVKGEKELKRKKRSKVKEHEENTYRMGNKRIRINKKLNDKNELQVEDQEFNEIRPDEESSEMIGILEYCISDVELDGDETQLSEESDDTDDDLNDESVDATKRKRKPKVKHPVDREFVRFMRNYAKKGFKRLSRKEKADLYLSIYSKKDDEEDVNEEDVWLEQEILDQTVILNLITDNEERKAQDEKVMKLKEQYHFSKFTKNIIRIGLFKPGERQRTIERVKSRDVNRMTSTKTICFIYTAIRLLNYDIYLFDLIRWINFNNIPYFSLCHLLPSDWLFIENDYLTFIRNHSPQLTKLNTSLTPIVNYLEITQFPLPNIKRLIVRIVNDLNLPDSFAKFVCNIFDRQMSESEQTREIFNRNQKSNWFTVPEYESVTFGLIFLSLKHLFCVNDYHETLLSEKLKESTSTSKFIWSDWEEHTNFKLECFKAYIYPFKESKKNCSQIENYEMYAEYYLNGIEYPKHDLFEPFVRKTKKVTSESTKELFSLFEKMKTNEEDHQVETKIEPSFYSFTSYTDYISRNFKTRNDDLLTKDFRSKRIDYLFKKNCRNISIENPKLIQPKNRSEYEQHNDKIKFLISLAVTYLNSHFLSFLRITISVERFFFPSYYKLTDDEKLVKMSKKELKTKSKESAKQQVSSFLDDFLAEISLAPENKKFEVFEI